MGSWRRSDQQTSVLRALVDYTYARVLRLAPSLSRSHSIFPNAVYSVSFALQPVAAVWAARVVARWRTCATLSGRFCLRAAGRFKRGRGVERSMFLRRRVGYCLPALASASAARTCSMSFPLAALRARTRWDFARLLSKLIGCEGRWTCAITAH